MERSITAGRLIPELERVFAAADGPPLVLRMDNGPELISGSAARPGLGTRRMAFRSQSVTEV